MTEKNDREASGGSAWPAALLPAGPAIDGKTLVIAALDGTLYAFPLT